MKEDLKSNPVSYDFILLQICNGDLYLYWQHLVPMQEKCDVDVLTAGKRNGDGLMCRISNQCRLFHMKS